MSCLGNCNELFSLLDCKRQVKILFQENVPPVLLVFPALHHYRFGDFGAADSDLAQLVYPVEIDVPVLCHVWVYEVAATTEQTENDA